MKLLKKRLSLSRKKAMKKDDALVVTDSSSMDSAEEPNAPKTTIKATPKAMNQKSSFEPPGHGPKIARGAPEPTPNPSAKGRLSKINTQTTSVNMSAPNSKKNVKANLMQKLRGQEKKSSTVTFQPDATGPEEHENPMNIPNVDLSQMIKKKNAPTKVGGKSEFIPMKADRPRPASMSMSKRNEEQFKKFVERQNVGRQNRSNQTRAW